MQKRPLIETNPYLCNRETYEQALFINVSSSTAVELGPLSPAIAKALKERVRKIHIVNGAKASV